MVEDIRWKERAGAELKVEVDILEGERARLDGYIGDMAYAGIVDNEWPAVKKRLVGLLCERR